ncbi:MAG: hypothetical protein QOI20_2982 [Acidimicrobiaceae bacterium]|jgi:hypothetical protein|nr:hypothetical protein [Acidimicrobiaceae bacterium]
MPFSVRPSQAQVVDRTRTPAGEHDVTCPRQAYGPANSRTRASAESTGALHT